MAKDFFENIGKTITNAADTAVNKTEDFFTVTKIKGKIAEENRMIDQICRNIGHEVFKEYLSGTAYSEAIAEMCKDIERHEGVIKEQERDLNLFQSKKAAEAEEKESEVVSDDMFEEEE